MSCRGGAGRTRLTLVPCPVAFRVPRGGFKRISRLPYELLVFRA